MKAGVTSRRITGQLSAETFDLDVAERRARG
jgi:hypothetical protein